MKKKQKKIKKKNKVNKKTVDVKWVIQVTIMSFIISLIFSGGSGIVLEQVNVYLGGLIVIFFILVGVIFDMIGIAVASGNQKSFHSMAAKRVKSSKTAIKMLKEAEKVSAFCNDVIGDICNIVSGSAGAVIAVAISIKFNLEPVIMSLLVTATIAALTIGGKAIGKSYAIDQNKAIIYKVAKICNVFWKK